MHSHDITADGENFTIHTNGDFSGGVILNVRPTRTAHNNYGDVPMVEVEIPFAVLEELVGRKYQRQHISEVEQQSGAEFLAVRR